MCLGIMDADLIMYRAACAAEHVYYGVYPRSLTPDALENDRMILSEYLIEEFPSSRDMKVYLKGIGKTEKDFYIHKRVEVQPVFQAKLILDGMIARAIQDTGCTESVFFLSDKTNFRHRVAVTTPYKVRDKEKPTHYQAMKDYLIGKYQAVIVSDLEADDALATWANLCAENDQPCVIISGDKDMRQVPGLHYSIITNKLEHVNVDQSFRLFFKQVLMGDATDSIPGLPGLGIKTADKHIDPCNTLEEMIKKTRDVYLANKKLDVPDRMKYLNEQANLIYLRRDPNQGVEL